MSLLLSCTCYLQAPTSSSFSAAVPRPLVLVVAWAVDFWAPLPLVPLVQLLLAVLLVQEDLQKPASVSCTTPTKAAMDMSSWQ